VVLRHQTPDSGVHWDLMLEAEGALATWQLARWPVEDQGEGESAWEIARHRVAYLSYEGPISGGRGEVRRVDEGRYVRYEESAGMWEVIFSGKTLQGRWRLWRAAGEEWRLQRLE
jgi:hypothetical protein